VACLNLHASLLPRWRGAAPIQAAIAAGDRDTGITVMYMAEGLDTGDILLQHKLAIARDETGGSLHDRLSELAQEALREAFQQLGHSNAPRFPQDEAQASYAPKLNREAGRIDWSEPAEVIERKIRAFDPWPGAFTMLNGPKPRKMKIFSARILDDKGTPGKVLRGDEHGFVIATGRQSLLLRDVQVEGSVRMRAAELARGYRGKLEVDPK
jgi:methionyl-tRNA formyltransferase